MSFNKNIKDQGFTIVELLIVIVVIGILAAITIVAYNGIQNRGKAVAAQSAANALDKKAEIYFAENGQYPVTTSVITGTGTQNSVTTATTSSWYSAQGSAFTTTAGTAASTSGMYNGIAAPTDAKTLYYTSSVAATGGCIWYYDYQNTTWKSVQVGSVTCPALPTVSTSSLASIAI